MGSKRLSSLKKEKGFATLITVSDKITSASLRRLVSGFNTETSGILNRIYRKAMEKSSGWTGTRRNVLHLCRVALEQNINRDSDYEFIRDTKQRCYLAVTRFIERHVKFKPSTQVFELITEKDWSTFKETRESVEVNAILGFNRDRLSLKEIPAIPKLLLDLYSEHFEMTTPEIDRQVDLLLREHGHAPPKPENRIKKVEKAKSMKREPGMTPEKLTLESISADGNLKKLNALIKFTSENPKLASRVLDKSIEFTKEVIQEQLTKLRELENEIE